MKEKFTTATHKFIISCNKCNIELLREAIAEGADINYRDEEWESPFDDMAFGARMEHETENADGYTIDDLIEFATVLIDNGFDISRTPLEENEEIGTFYHIAKWGRSLKYLEFMLSKGLNPNYIMEGGFSSLDHLESSIWIEETACEDSDYASYLYEAVRLSIAYGALPTIHLKKQYEPGEEEWYQAAMNLDIEFFKNKNADELIAHHADDLVVEHSKYGYSKESFYEIEKLQSRIIPVLDIIIKKIGIDKLNESTLNECVKHQYVDILEHLLKMGANPYVNCFSEGYAHIKSSAKYTLEKEGHYYKREARDRMKELLSNKNISLRNLRDK